MKKHMQIGASVIVVGVFVTAAMAVAAAQAEGRELHPLPQGPRLGPESRVVRIP